MSATAALAESTSATSVGGGVNNTTSSKQQSLSSLGGASGVSILLGNHAKFGLAERCCYHFDLIETLTSLPMGRVYQQQQSSASRIRRRDRGISISSQEGGKGTSEEGGGVKEEEEDEKDGNVVKKIAPTSKAKSSNNDDNSSTATLCGVVSLLECVTGGGTQPDRTTKRALRSKHREFNTRAQVAWGRRSTTSLKRRDKLQSSSSIVGMAGTASANIPRRCHQPRHLPLQLNPNTRVSFAYELTSIAIVIDASPSLTSTFGMMDNFDIGFGGGEEKKSNSSSTQDSNYCVPLDRLGPLIKSYLKGLVHPIDVPPVSVSGLGVAFGKWTPNLAVTVVAAYPPTSTGEGASAGLLVRDFRVTDEASALKLAEQIKRWALMEVEGVIAQRLCGGRDFSGVNDIASLGSFPLPSIQQMTGSRTSVKSSMRDILSVGDAALATLPPEGRPLLLIATDCCNVHCGGVFDSLSETARVDVPISILDLSSRSIDQTDGNNQNGLCSPLSPLSMSNDSQSLRDMCQTSGGIFLNLTRLDSYIGVNVGSAVGTNNSSSPLHGDYHFSFKKRSIKPNALQWYTLFTLSPFTPSGHSSSLRPMGSIGSTGNLRYRSSSIASFSGSSKHSLGKSAEMSNQAPPFMSDIRTRALGGTCVDQERLVLARYNIQHIRIKSLLMTRVVEGYRARRYGHNTQDTDKVSIHMVMPLQIGVVLHYEASFVSSPFHIPTVGQAHIKLEISGSDTDFIQTVKKMFVAHGPESIVLHGRRVSASSKAAAEKVCKLLRWTRKEDYLESYLCLPGWGDTDHFASGSSFLSRLESMSALQRFRHFRSESFEVVSNSPSFYEKTASIFSEAMEHNHGEGIYSALAGWSSGTIADRTLYFKVIAPAQDDDLAYYCIIHVAQSNAVSRLFTITIDFHGELSAESRLSVLSSLKHDLRNHTDILVLEKCISNYVNVTRPMTALSRQWSPYFVHAKNWELLQDSEVLPLITKRRNEIGNFFILHSDAERGVFAKFVKSCEQEDPVVEASSPHLDIVIYQVISKANGIYVDIYMEASHSTFHPFSARRADTTFAKLSERVRKRDVDCARNVKSRTNLLAALDDGKCTNVQNRKQEAEDVMRLIKISKCTKKHLRFFSLEGSGLANDILSHLTTECITSESFHTRASRLSIGQNVSIMNYSGTWFVMRLDWYILSLMCLEVIDHIQEMNGMSQNFRRLSIFTAAIMDLYQSDYDFDDSSGDDSEQFGVSEIMEAIESSHAENFATACYQALRNTTDPIVSLQDDEVDYALTSLYFRESLQTFVSVDDLSDHLSEHAHTITGRKLAQVIESLLRIVPGSNGRLFFYHDDDVDCSDESVAHSNVSQNTGFMIGTAEEGGLEVSHSVKNPPLFFRFSLDEQLVGMDEIMALKKSATLSAQVSVFQSSSELELPPSHTSIVAKVQKCLDSFAAEQVLEKLRFVGRSLTDELLERVMLNLPQTNQLHSCEIPLHFFISKSKSLVAADNPTGNNERDLTRGFRILLDECDQAHQFIRANEESFLVLDDSASRDVLPYFCFIQIQKSRGSIIVRVYHPLGDEAAEQQMKVVQSLVKSICDRTNQLLLLGSLYNTKNACSLLIPEEEDEQAVDGKGEKLAAATYACPVQHEVKIPLHRRCSPQQAILALDTTILQNFTISNRRGFFVYKDESDHVFYMKLNWYKIQDAEETDQYLHTIELQVFGCDKPGPSITEQLVSLLKRKILTFSLDALSSLLKKNPWFNLLHSDLMFIKSFEGALRELDSNDEDDSPPSDSIRIYSLPQHIRDPLIIMLMFRQNVCGSTFIQHLHYDDASTGTVQLQEDRGDFKLCFNELPEFQFYFNSHPSQLDPNFQPLTTLTYKGREFSRKAGSGIAIIEVNLMYGNDAECEIIVGKQGEAINSNTLHVNERDISLSRYNPPSDEHCWKIKVEITNTTVDIDIIHQWIELSLAQVLSAWSIERHLESSHLGMLQNTEQNDFSQNSCNGQSAKQISIDKTMTGVTALEDMIGFANRLPHPAVSTIENKGMLKATGLSNLTLKLLDAMLSSIAPATRSRLFEAVDIIRYTSSSGASLVKITKDNTPKKCARVELSGTRKVVRDRSIDNPEYISVFGFNDKSMSSSSKHLFFKHVNFQISSSTQQETSVFSQALSKIQAAKPSLFRRHLVFILRVSKRKRSLMIYNANPQLRLQLENNFKQIENAVAKADEQGRDSLQKRCLSHIGLAPTDQSKQDTVSNDPTNDATPIKPKSKEKKPEQEEPVVKRPARRIPRPTSMLRPTLIGKSVEGSTAAAMQASRLRARAATRPSPVSGGRKKIEATQDKTVPRKKRESVVHKDATSIVRTSPQASLLKVYRAFLSLLKEDGADTLISQHRLNQSSIQNLAHMFFKSLNEKGGSSASLSTRLMCSCYGNFVGTGSIQQLDCDNEMASLKSFVDHIVKHWDTTMIRVDKQSKSSSHLPQTVYLRKDLLTSASRKAVIMMEVSIHWNNLLNSFTLSYNAWLVNSADMNKLHQKRSNRKPFASLRRLEREAGAIEAVVLDFLGKLNVESEIFNFACFRITRRVAQEEGRKRGPSTLSLLRSVMTRYMGPEDQAQLSNSAYRLQRRFMAPSSFLEGPLLESCKTSSLAEHLLSNDKTYNLTPCTGSKGDDICFVGRIKVAGFLVYYFIAWHESVESALDVFILSLTNGQFIDGYITKEGSPFAEKILDVILYSTMSTVQDLIEEAAKAIRQLQVWQSFGVNNTPHLLGATLMANVIELRASSFHLDLVDVDPRLQTLLFDDLNDLEIPWRDVFNALTRSRSCSHCITLTEGEASTHIVYYKDEDIFLDFSFDLNGKVQTAQILARDQFSYDENTNTSEAIATRCAVNKFTAFVLQWLWSDCESS